MAYARIVEWELVRRAAAPALRRHVIGYCGYHERTDGPARRREIPVEHVPLIVNLGTPLRMLDPGRPDAPGDDTDAFVAGLHDRHAMYEHPGVMRGIQVDLTPFAARLLLRAPMSDVANRTVALEDFLGPQAARLAEQLEEAGTWERCFELVDVALGRLLDDAPQPRPDVVWAWSRLRETHGALRIEALTSELGCSRRHLAARFREYLGLSPKTIARVLRFRRAVELLDGDEARWAEIAAASGYYDQSHFNRDFRELAGATPTEFLRLRIDDAPGLAA